MATRDDVTVGVKVVLTNSEGTKSAVGAVTVPGTGWGRRCVQRRRYQRHGHSPP